MRTDQQHRNHTCKVIVHDQLNHFDETNSGKYGAKFTVGKILQERAKIRANYSSSITVGVRNFGSFQIQFVET